MFLEKLCVFIHNKKYIHHLETVIILRNSTMSWKRDLWYEFEWTTAERQVRVKGSGGEVGERECIESPSREQARVSQQCWGSKSNWGGHLAGVREYLSGHIVKPKCISYTADCWLCSDIEKNAKLLTQIQQTTLTNSTDTGSYAVCIKLMLIYILYFTL